MCKCYLYESFNDIRIALNDINNDDIYSDHTCKLNWDNFTEILAHVTSHHFCLPIETVRYITKVARDVVGKNSYECIDKVVEYARLTTGLIDYGHVIDVYINQNKN